MEKRGDGWKDGYQTWDYIQNEMAENREKIIPKLLNECSVHNIETVVVSRDGTNVFGFDEFHANERYPR